MIRLLEKYKGYMLGIVALMVVEPSLNAMLNFWLQRLFNAAEPGASLHMLLRLLTGGFLLWLIKRLVSFASGMLKARYLCNARQDIKQRLFANMMKLNTSNLSALASSGEYISLFTNDINLLETRFFNQIISLISGVFSVVILGASFMSLNMRLAAAILGFGFAAMFVPTIFSKALNAKNLTYSKAMSAFTQRMKEYLVAYPTIKNYAVENAVIDRFSGVNKGTEDAKFDADYALNLANSVGQLLSWFMQFIAVGLGLVLVVRGEITLGTVIAAQGFAGDLASPLQGIISNINSIHSMKSVAGKLNALCSREAKTDGADEKPAMPAAPILRDGCDVDFDHVSLHIGVKKIIDDFTFRFEKGKKYLIVGINGSGKSSLFRMLKNWFGACTGRILIDGRPVSSMKNEQLSRIVSYLGENVSMFSGTVQDNIELFRPCDQAALQYAMRAAKVKLDPEREITDEGRNISSGEQRRIEIARTMVDSVGVMIFDEVVSTLDIETAYEIEKMALGFENKTVVFISHNFSGKLIREYDEILVMDQGRLIAHGAYEELMKTCGYFRRICDIKFGTMAGA